ncbi:MAG: MBL fold metallo-hydrolase [Candidatus Latescibacteria bacterium]|nr:MBL fold metallo-hydrolase [Candidatus Latescibacterota bacterium]
MTATKAAAKTGNRRDLTILFLGTGAGDWPAEVPPERRKDRNWRRQSAILVNGQVLVDCGPNAVEALDTFEVDPRQIGDLLLTHSHFDHFSPQVLDQLVQRRADLPPLRVWGHAGALEQVKGRVGVEICPLVPGSQGEAGSTRFEALAANHWVEGEQALHYLFSGETCHWLYAVDGAWILEPTWNRVRELGLDVVVLDATLGEGKEDERIFAHNSLAMVDLLVEALHGQQVIRTGGQVFLTHFGRQHHPDQDVLEKDLARKDLVPVYDGMYVHINDVGEDVE